MCFLSIEIDKDPVYDWSVCGFIHRRTDLICALRPPRGPLPTLSPPLSQAFVHLCPFALTYRDQPLLDDATQGGLFVGPRRLRGGGGWGLFSAPGALLCVTF